MAAAAGLGAGPGSTSGSGSDRRWDYVITTARKNDLESGGCCGGGKIDDRDLSARSWVEDNLRAAGLLFSTVVSQDGSQFIIRIGATQERLERHAEYIRLQLPTRIPREPGDTSSEEQWGDCAPFVARTTDPRKRALFPDEFNSFTRQEIIRSILEEKPMLRYPGKYPGYDRGAGINIALKIGEGVILSCYPLHDKQAQKYLMETWVKKPFSFQPLDRIRDYFGEKIALYFAFVGFYTTWLFVPTIIGIVVFALQRRSVFGTDSIINPIYMFLMMLWSTLFLEFWKRNNSKLALHWNVLGYEERERARPQFRGEEQLGFYTKGNYWISLEDEAVMKGTQKVDRYGGRPIPENLYATGCRRVGFYALSAPILAAMLVLVCIVSIAVLLLRVYMLSSVPQFAVNYNLPVPSAPQYVATGLNAALNAVVIIILNEVYARLAAFLTDLENHRTQTSYEDALILKTFLFQFVNSYFTLFYIAFFKGKYRLCLGTCRIDFCANNDCFEELSQQLLIIFGVKQLALQIFEVLLPLIKYFITSALENRRIKKLVESGQPPPPKRSQAEAEGLRPEYESTFDDYNELIIQFGYVILFVVAFPLSPLFAFVNNLIEIRVDAFRLLRAHRRPALGRSEDIGTWYYILEVLSIVGVITNCFILGFTSEGFAVASGFSITQRIWFAFIAEHCLLAVKVFIAFIIPDVPGDVVREMAKKAWIRECQMEALEQEEAGRPVSAPQERPRSVPKAAVTGDALDSGIDQLRADELEDD